MIRFRIAALLLLAAPALGAQAAAAHTTMTDDTTYTAVANRFVRALVAGRPAEAAALVSPSVPAGRMGAEQLGPLWAQVTAQFGEVAEVRPIGVAAQGEVHAASLAVRFARSEMELRVVLDDRRQVVGFWFSPPKPPAYAPPPYADTATFAEHDLSLGSGPTALGATFSSPRSGGLHPAVVLVHGSGPNDRDETVGANRPFRDVAWGLASRGVAVLRYDKRTYAHPTQVPASEITAAYEVLDDAAAALALARAQPGVDPARVYVLGHSLGAGFAPAIAERDGQVAGVVMLAGSPRPLSDVLIEQVEYLDSLQASPAGPGQKDALIAQLRQVSAKALPPSAPVFGMPASYWYDLASYDATAAARRLRVPALVLQGGRDYQVTERDLALWRKAFEGSHRATFQLYPDLNHLFMTGTGRATPAEYQTQTGHVAEQVVTDIAHFVGAAR